MVLLDYEPSIGSVAGALPHSAREPDPPGSAKRSTVLSRIQGLSLITLAALLASALEVPLPIGNFRN